MIAILDTQSHRPRDKHAGDVCRVLALTTRDERTHAPELIEKLRSKAPFQDAARRSGFLPRL